MSKTPITDRNAFNLWTAYPAFNINQEFVKADVARKLEEQRNELLAALERLVAWGDKPCNWKVSDYRRDFEQARADIAAAKEGV